MYILKPKFVLIYINLYNLHLYLLIHLLYVLYSTSIRHARLSTIEKQFYYYCQIIQFVVSSYYYIFCKINLFSRNEISFHFGEIDIYFLSKIIYTNS